MATKTKKVTGAEIVADARRYFGVPYVYGGTNRSSGLDCSGLVLVVCEDCGITSCPRTSEEQYAWTERVDAKDILPGDLVFFVGAELDPPPGHVGIVVSPGQMIDAPYTGTVVQQQHFTNGSGVNKIIGYGRIPGVTYSTPVNSSTTSASKSSQQNIEAAGLVATVISWIFIVIAFAVILLALALVGAFAFNIA